jgi:hypothetical protein
MPVILAVWKVTGRRIMVWDQPRVKTLKPTSKITKAKRIGGVAQVEEHLCNKYKPLSSNPSTKNLKKNGWLAKSDFYCLALYR